MRFFKRGEIADSKFTFLDSETNAPIDVLNPQYKISYFSGANEVILVDWTPLDHIVSVVGQYIVSYQILETDPENETYYITVSGEHPVDHTITLIEDFYRVLARDFFGGGSGSGLVAKFTKP